MKRFIFLILLALLTPWAARATAFTASTNSGTPGNWNSAATWGGAGVPGSGDTITIPTGKGVFCNDTEAVGTSVASNNDFVVTGTGQFTMNSGCVLSVKGDALWDSGASFICSASSGAATWQFVVPGGDAYFFAWSNVGTPPFTFNMQGASWSSPCIFTTASGGGSGTITNGGHLVNLAITLQFSELTNLGSASVKLDFSDTQMTVAPVINHLLVDNSGELNLTFGTKTLGFTWNAIDFRRCLDTSNSNRCFFLDGTGVPATARLITNLTSYNVSTSVNKLVTIILNGTQVGQSKSFGDAANTPGFLGYNSQWAPGSADALNVVCRMCFQVSDWGANGFNSYGQEQGSGQKYQDDLVLQQTQNQHEWVSTGSLTTTPNAFQNIVADGNGMVWSDTGNVITDGFTFTVGNLLNINTAGEFNSSGPNTPSGAWTNLTAFQSNPLEVDGPATVMTAARNNLFVYPQSGSTSTMGFDSSGFTSSATLTRQTGLSLDYNFFWMMSGSGDTLSLPGGITKNANTCTTGGYCLLPNAAISGSPPSYVSAPVVQSPLQASTASTAGTTTATTVNAASASFVTAGLQSGDYLCDETLTAKLCAPIQSVNSATQVTLLSPGLTSLNGTGHNVSGRIGFMSATSQYYGVTAGYGTHDQHSNPQFVDATRSLCTWYKTASGNSSECAGLATGQIDPINFHMIFTSTASTDTTHIFCTTCNFSSWGLGTYTVVQTFSGSTTTVRGRALVASVTSNTELTLATAITGQTSGDLFTFVTATQGVGQGIAGINGWDWGSGASNAPTSITPITWSSPMAALAYIRAGFTPMNSQLKNAAKPSDCSGGNPLVCDVGAVPVYPAAAQRMM